MQGQISPKIIGSTLIGFALVAGAYLMSDFNKRELAVPVAQLATSTPQRVAIAVTDTNDNGIEDWRDEFVTTAPIILNESTSTYSLPDTLTGKMSISFMENVIRSKTYGPFGRTEDEVINTTIKNLASETEITLYDTPDISIITEWDDADIRNYANTVASVILNNSIESEGELNILYDVLQSNNQQRISELEAVANVYKNYRDDTIKVPVPAFLAKEHLDLINSYHAIHQDIAAMAIVFDDPAVSLLRLKRYQDDATGLGLSLQNMYFALEPYARLVTAEDPATLFVLFNPDLKIN
ncbi:MAG: hypothetical protein RL097_760 [Candidatus Parcubacteria bacterium]